MVVASWMDDVHGQATRPPVEGKTAAPPSPIAVRKSRTAEEMQKLFRDLSRNDATISVILGQARLLTLKQDLVKKAGASPLIAVGDPGVIDFDVVGPRTIRITGRQFGTTDLSITTADGKDYNFEVQVVADLSLLKLKLKQLFPGAQLEFVQMRQHVVVGGQARDSRQVDQILGVMRAFLSTIQPPVATGGGGGAAVEPPPEPGGQPAPKRGAANRIEVRPQAGGRPAAGAGRIATPQIINLIRVPGAQQVLLKVQVAELNRTALRQLGVSFLLQSGSNAVGQTLGGGLSTGGAGGGGAAGTGAAALLGAINPLAGGASTAFGIFDGGKVNFLFTALRQNQVLKILAEPNLVALNGQSADFLAGGQFPVPVPQPGGSGPSVVTIQYKSFGVSLNFVPFILDDDRIRLSVQPEVSSIDFSTGVVIQGTAVPGINTRRTNTTVEMREGQTLAISGILQVQMDGSTARIPGLGDLPYIGSLFRNTSSQKSEKELVVLVTPYLVQPMNADQVSARPGDDVDDPTDIELYLLGRIERRACREDFRATTSWDDPLNVEKRRRIEDRYVIGPYGYSE